VEFFETEASGGIVLIVATLVALAWANSGFQQSYHDLWHTKIGFGWGDHKLVLDLHHWINDGLMAVFFLLVGLEIKREVLAGELASLRKAALPAMAALGGMVVPAAVYAVLNREGAGQAGWGIPMATDIAFAIGVLMLLGSRVPIGLKIFLTALAVVDDLGAVMVIAIFYTAQLDWMWLLLGLATVVFLFLLPRIRVTRRSAFLVAGVFVWFCFLKSGVHATVAGVLVALAIPLRAPIPNPGAALGELAELGGSLRDRELGPDPADEEHRTLVLQRVHDLADKSASPLYHLEHALGPWVSYGIMPVFALANAGVVLDGDALAGVFREPVPLGILLGLVIGKQLGITGFSWLAVRLGWASLPSRVGWGMLHGAAILGGIGFTMSIFIANLAFREPALLDEAKMGVLVASFVAALLGMALLLFVTRGERGKEVSSA
jgi:NhaA family Na+:H+ antiporter